MILRLCRRGGSDRSSRADGVPARTGQVGGQRLKALERGEANEAGGPAERQPRQVRRPLGIPTGGISGRFVRRRYAANDSGMFQRAAEARNRNVLERRCRVATDGAKRRGRPGHARGVSGSHGRPQWRLSRADNADLLPASKRASTAHPSAARDGVACGPDSAFRRKRPTPTELHVRDAAASPIWVMKRPISRALSVSDGQGGSDDAISRHDAGLGGAPAQPTPRSPQRREGRALDQPQS